MMDWTKLEKHNESKKTLCGVVFKDGVIFGADTKSPKRANDVMENEIHFLGDTLTFGTVGINADCQYTASQIQLQHILNEFNIGDTPVAAANLVKNLIYSAKCKIDTEVLLAGVSGENFHVNTVEGDGHMDRLPYATLGFRNKEVMSILEAGWKENLSEENAKQLVCKALAAGFFKEKHGCCKIDYCVVTSNESTYYRTYTMRANRSQFVNYAVGTTEVLHTEEITD